MRKKSRWSGCKSPGDIEMQGNQAMKTTAQPMKNVKEPRPIKFSPDLRVEPPFWSPELVVVVGFGVVVTLDEGGRLDEDG